MGQRGLPCTPPMILLLGCHFVHWCLLRWKKDVNKKKTHLDYVFFSHIGTHVKSQLFQQVYLVLGAAEIWADIIACISVTTCSIFLKLGEKVHSVILYSHMKLYIHIIFHSCVNDVILFAYSEICGFNWQNCFKNWKFWLHLSKVFYLDINCSHWPSKTYQIVSLDNTKLI